MQSEDLEMQAGEVKNPERVEKVLGEIEGESKEYIDEMLKGGFPPRQEARFRLSMYVALQITRGWSFRHQVNELTTLMAPHFVELHATPERVRATLRRLGQPHGPADVKNMIAQLIGPAGLRPVFRQGHYVQEMLRV